MSKHIKIVVSVLFIVIIFFAIALTRFYSDTTRTPEGNSAHADIEKKHAADQFGNRIFENSAGLYGLLDSSDRIIVAPEWLDLSFTDSSRFIVKSRINGRQLFGCVDYEGNVTIPVVYKSIDRRTLKGLQIYTAETDSDGSWVIYDKGLDPMFPNSWKTCIVDNDKLTVTDGKGSFVYTSNGESLALTEANVSGNALGCDYEIRIVSSMLLSKLDPLMIEEIASTAGHYLEYAYTGDTGYLADVRTNGGFSMLFPDEKKIVSRKLSAIDSMFIYTTTTPNGELRFNLAVNADTETAYTSDEGRREVIKGRYKAVLEFGGSSMSDLKMLSAGFTKDKPDYPEKAEENTSAVQNRQANN